MDTKTEQNLGSFNITHVFASKPHLTTKEYREYLFATAVEYELLTRSEIRRLEATIPVDKMQSLHALERILYSNWLKRHDAEKYGKIHAAANGEESLFAKLEKQDAT